MKTRNLIFIITLILLNGTLLFGQVQNPISDVLPPSPNAASLGFFAKNNVNLHIGAPNVEVPLYEAKEGNLTVPISLSYNSTGVKPNERTSWVGMSWALNAGGVITRETRNHPDEWASYGFFENRDKIFNIDPADDVFGSFTDYEPDIFYFNFGKYSGKFFCSNEGVTENKLIFYTVPNYNFKITCNIDPCIGMYMINQITITTDDGTQYIFGDKDAHFANRDDKPVEYTQKVTSVGDGTPDLDKFPVTSSWYLAKIISPNGNQSITLNYKGFKGTVEYAAENYFSYIWSYAFNWDLQKPNPWKGTCIPLAGVLGLYVCPFNGPVWASKGSEGTIKMIENRTIVWRRYLSSIETTNEIIDFNFSQNDFLLYSEAFTNSSPTTINYHDQKLDKITITNKISTSIIKEISFCYDNPAFRLTLDAVNLTAGTQTNSYKFSYNNIYALPGYLTDKYDHWGYLISPDDNSLCNSTRVLQPLIYLDETNTEQQAPSNRGPDLSLTGIGMLNKIEYPTGGSTSFDYEQNTYNAYLTRPALGENAMLCGYAFHQLTTFGYAGGCRVKKMIEDNGKGQKIVKQYTYYNGILSELPNYSYTSQGSLLFMSDVTTNVVGYLVHQNIPLNSFSTTSGSSICYSRVVESLSDGSNTETIFSNFDNHTDILEGYSFHKVLVDKNGNKYVPNAVFPFLSPVTTRDFERGKTLQVNYRDKNNNLVKRTDYGYINTCTSVIDDVNQVNSPNLNTYNALAVKSVKCLRKGNSMPNMDLGSFNPADPNDAEILSSTNFLCTYLLPYYPYLLSYEKTTTYPGTVFEQVDYYYSSNECEILGKYLDKSYCSEDNVQVKWKVFKEESNGKIKSIKYTYPTDYSIQPFTGMVDKNIINQVVTSEEFVDNNKTSGTARDFYGSSYYYLPKLDKNWNSISNTNYTTVNYDSYNLNGLLTEFHKENDAHTSILYAYNSNMPIAKVENTSNADITTTMGSTWLNDLGILYADADILTKVNLLRTNLPTKHIQSYLYNINYGTVSSEFPYSNNKTTYEYDNWGRLVNAKDYNGNVLKSYKYNIINTSSSVTCPNYELGSPINYDARITPHIEICKITIVNTDGSEQLFDGTQFAIFKGYKYRVYFKSSIENNHHQLYLDIYNNSKPQGLFYCGVPTTSPGYIDWTPDCDFTGIDENLIYSFIIMIPGEAIGDGKGPAIFSQPSTEYFYINQCQPIVPKISFDASQLQNIPASGFSDKPIVASVSNNQPFDVTFSCDNCVGIVSKNLTGFHLNIDANNSCTRRWTGTITSANASTVNFTCSQLGTAAFWNITAPVAGTTLNEGHSFTFTYLPCENSTIKIDLVEMLGTTENRVINIRPSYPSGNTEMSDTYTPTAAGLGWDDAMVADISYKIRITSIDFPDETAESGIFKIHFCNGTCP